MSLKIWLIAVLFLAAYVAPSLQEEQEDVEDAPKEVEESDENAGLSDLEDPSPSKGCTSYGYCYRWCAKYWKRCYSYPRSKHSCCRCCKYRGDEVEVKSDENQVEDAPKEMEESDENAELSDLEDPSPGRYLCNKYGYCYNWCTYNWKKCYYPGSKHRCCRCGNCYYRGDEVEVKSDENQVEDAPKEVEDLEDPSPSRYYGCSTYGYCYKWCAKYLNRKLCKRGSKHGCCSCRWCRRYPKGDEVETKSDEEEVEDSEDPSYKRCGYYTRCYYYYGNRRCRKYYRCHYGR